MFKNYHPGSYSYLAKWQVFTKNNLDLQWPFWGAFQLDTIAYLRNVLNSRESQVEQTEHNAYFNWYASKSLQDPKITSLKDPLQKANEKLKAQEITETEDGGDSCDPSDFLYSLP